MAGAGKQFEASSDYQLKLVDFGNRDVVADLFRDGELDIAICMEVKSHRISLCKVSLKRCGPGLRMTS